MSDEIILGGSQMDQFLQSLPVKVERSILRGMVNAAAAVIRDEAKVLAPVGPPSSTNATKYGGYAGALRDSIRVSSRVKNGQVVASVKVGGKGGKSRGADVFYAHMVEFGTRPHRIKAKPPARALSIGGGSVTAVDHPGTAAQPFMRPALDNKSSAAIAAGVAYVKKRLTKQGINTEVPIPPEAD